MLVSRNTQKLVLKVEDPRRITNVIPTARTLTYKGVELVAVPHEVEEVKVLRNLGHDVAPSPIKYYYDWPIGGGYDRPFHAQVETAAFLTMEPRAYVLNDLGTGKTLSALWAYDYLRTKGRASKMLVVCPLSTMERTWGDEVFKNFAETRDLRVAILHGSKEQRLKRLAMDADIYVVNHHGVCVLEKDLLARPDIDVVCIDELARFRNASTALWKSMNKTCMGRKYVWGMTGSPTPEKPTDAWAQVRLITPERVPRYFSAFRDMCMKQESQFKWLVRANATEVVKEAMQPAIRFTRDQCVDLPPCMYQTRSVELTPEQKTAYKSMASKLTMEYAAQQVTAVNEAVKHLKLLQIACGIVYDTSGREVVLPNKPRIDELKEVIEEAEGKVIVFVPFKSVLAYVAGELRAAGLTVETISGDVSKSNRDRIFGAFQQDPTLRVLCAVPDAMSHGLTLTQANTIVWYSPTNKNEVYQQANARITRPGQKRTQFIVELEGSPVERGTYKRLRQKESMQGLLLESVTEKL